jgi:hypothetical protein
MPEPKRPGIPTLGVCPPDGQKALSERHMIPDGLSKVAIPSSKRSRDVC